MSCSSNVGKMPKSSKRHNSVKIRRIYPKVTRSSTAQNSMPNMKAQTHVRFEISCTQSYVPTFESGAKLRNYRSTREEKGVNQLIFHKQLMYKLSKPWHIYFLSYEKSPKRDEWTDERTTVGQAEGNMPLTFFEVGGIKSEEQ